MDLRPVLATANRQHGLLTTAQLRQAGGNARAVARLVDAGILRRVRRGVYRLAGSPATYAAASLAALLPLGGGAWASHLSAAALHGFVPSAVTDELPSPPLAVTVGHERSGRLAGIQMHRSRQVPPHHVTRRQRVPVTTPARTLVDLATTTLPAQQRRWTGQVLRDGLCTAGAIHTVLRDLLPSGRSGLARAAAALRALTADERAPDLSELERVARRVLCGAGLTPTGWEINVSGRVGWLGRVDAVYGPERVIAESTASAGTTRRRTQPATRHYWPRDGSRSDSRGPTSRSVRTSPWPNCGRCSTAEPRSGPRAGDKPRPDPTDAARRILARPLAPVREPRPRRGQTSNADAVLHRDQCGEALVGVASAV